MPKIKNVDSVFDIEGENITDEILEFFTNGAKFLADKVREIDKPKEGTIIHIVAYYDKFCGINICEIGFVLNNFGSTIMACEADSLGILSAARMVLLNHNIEPYRPETWESDIDLRQEQVDNLAYLWNKQEENNVDKQNAS